MKSLQKKPNQPNKITIVKNKEIIIYQNGEEFKRFKQSETKELNDDEMYILDFLLKKYSIYEIPKKYSTIVKENDFEFESTDDFFKKKQDKRIENSQTPNTNNFYDEEEDKKTEPKLKEYFKDIDDEKIEKDFENLRKDEVTETKKLKKGVKTIEELKVPIQKKNKNKNINYRYEEENVDINEENEEEEESEESPQYIIELESYTSPTFKYINKKKAEEEILQGIKASMMINGKEKKGILFLGDKERIIFTTFENKIENYIPLNNLKRIYFNIKGSENTRSYKKKSDKEKFIQIVELNNKKTDFKFDTYKELEYFVLGIIQTFKNKIPPIDKNIIYDKFNNNFYTKNEEEEKKEEEKQTKISSKYLNYNKNNESKKISSKYLNEQNKTKNYSKKYEIRKNYTDNKNNNNYYYESKNYTKINKKYVSNDNNKNYDDNKKNNDEDNYVTTIVTEVYKDGKLINEEAKEESGGKVKTLHSYSPNVEEYKEYLRKSNKRINDITDDDLNRSLNRASDL